MRNQIITSGRRHYQAFQIALSGFLALVVAMGIGRFTFTPQVPLMIAESQFTLTGAGIVAAFNYLGYLAGSYDAMRAQRFVEYRLWSGLWGAVIITLLSALLDGPILHSIARFFIGWASGWTLVLVAAWANDELAKLNRPRLSAAVFAGTGMGILISGVLAVGIQSWAMGAAKAWVIYGMLALLCSIYVSRYLPRRGELHRPQTNVQKLILTPEIKRLVWSYSLAGFGYILPATFLSQMATERFPDSLFAQFVWPIFGGASVLGIVLGILLSHVSTTQIRLAITLWLQAIGILIAEVLPGIGGLVIGALLVGGGFMCVVQLALLYGRELAPNHARYMAGLLTTGYALGQLVGPMLSAISTWLTGKLEPALYIAFIGLVVAGLLVFRRNQIHSE
ncbi:MFS transporter [Xenorhabdus bovienii]|uniref:MFS transporter n=1 Tax=Xenorhabdus bovienii TaxID=40576 RepID=A0AAJ1J594_XENBV|nr:YbfB/YjiJ family MFS transporter [Xenorhabdus bovienii]MDE1477542.1 MFS transporter [Xenorhabdus bovienii]MDE1487238.1 MFS transporter [Xenorhabdus bovienii]MDE1490403.1 MFS transporter [Xenorhabdus bovienii]MDE9478050.1 MFS transporter [Xenorhabdus bovienii]MDE9509283.1 MFS transporter [Xenorhabdus bovienii]